MALEMGGLVAVLGFIVSNPTLLFWLASQDPILDFFLWYGVLAVWVAAAYWVLFRAPIRLNIDIALLILYFAFGTVFYWAASDAALLNAGISPQTVSNIPAFLLASEDQLISSAFMALGASPALAVPLTYWVVPALLVILALGFIAPNRAGSLLKKILNI